MRVCVAFINIHVARIRIHAHATHIHFVPNWYRCDKSEHVFVCFPPQKKKNKQQQNLNNSSANCLDCVWNWSACIVIVMCLSVRFIESMHTHAIHTHEEKTAYFRSIDENWEWNIVTIFSQWLNAHDDFFKPAFPPHSDADNRTKSITNTHTRMPFYVFSFIKMFVLPYH